MPTTIGIDQSLNSTGICVNENGTYTYYLITATATKRFIKAAESFQSLHVIPIPKTPSTKGIVHENNITEHIYIIIKVIKEIFNRHKPDLVITENIAFAANGRVIDLAGLGHCIRLTCREMNIPFLSIPPTTVKKQSVGLGSATKEMMILTWARIFPQFKPLCDHKVDDLADAYFICEYKPDWMAQSNTQL